MQIITVRKYITRVKDLKALIKFIKKNGCKENVMEEVTCYALQESYLYSVTEQNANFSEELQDEV